MTTGDDKGQHGTYSKTVYVSKYFIINCVITSYSNVTIKRHNEKFVIDKSLYNLIKKRLTF